MAKQSSIFVLFSLILVFSLTWAHNDDDDIINPEEIAKEVGINIISIIYQI